MIRISDARMSGTAFGTVVLHVAPDAASGGPLSLIRTGDEIELSVSRRRLDLLVADSILGERAIEAAPATGSGSGSGPTSARRGHDWLHAKYITQADQGCDFSFLRRDGVEE